MSKFTRIQFEPCRNPKGNVDMRVDGQLVYCMVPKYNGIEHEPVHSILQAAPALYEALKDVMAQLSGNPKSCGHDFNCVCPSDKARAALALVDGK